MSGYVNLSFVWCQQSCGIYFLEARMQYDKCIEN